MLSQGRAGPVWRTLGDTKPAVAGNPPKAVPIIDPCY